MIDGSALHLQVVNIVNHWGYFIYLSWMPSYFHQVAQAVVCALPLLSCADSDCSVTSWQVLRARKPACLPSQGLRKGLQVKQHCVVATQM